MIENATQTSINTVANSCELYQIAFHCELSNNMTMILELMIAGILATVLALYFFKREKDDRIKLEGIIQDDLEFKRNRRQYAINAIEQHLLDTKLNLPDKKYVADFDMQYEEQYREAQDLTPVDEFYYAIHFIENSKNISELASDVIETEFLEQLGILQKWVTNREHPKDPKEWALMWYDRIVENLNELSNKIQEMKIKEIKKTKGTKL